MSSNTYKTLSATDLYYSLHSTDSFRNKILRWFKSLTYCKSSIIYPPNIVWWILYLCCASLLHKHNFHLPDNNPDKISKIKIYLCTKLFEKHNLSYGIVRKLLNDLLKLWNDLWLIQIIENFLNNFCSW